ncbi:methyltransferase domain-containing protein [Amphibiibacter pelophylacis]|uniref:Methyltransferase domain-containing protein n=1 Tax=Amphibiibacter pelophylacis TaxID=1799477 RepID=A0ACC6NZ06_9BURK
MAFRAPSGSPPELAWRQRRDTRSKSGSSGGPALPEVSLSEINGVRYLHLGTPWVQGAMRIRQPLVLELEYIQRMMLWLLWRDDLEAQLAAPESDPVTSSSPAADPPGHALLEPPGTPWRVVQLGLGAGALTRFAAQRLQARTLAVELNPAVIAANRRHFALPEDGATLRVVHADAAAWLAAAPPASVEALQVDLYDHEAAAPVLDSFEFYRACRRVLVPGGGMCVNLFGRDSAFDRSMTQMALAFGPENLGHLPPTLEGNTVAFAYNGLDQPLPWDAAVMRDRASQIEALLGLPAPRWVRAWRPWEAPR